MSLYPVSPCVLPRRRFLQGALAAGALACGRGVFAADAPKAPGPSRPPPSVPSFGFTRSRDFTAWQRELRARLAAILALPPAPRGPLDSRIERDSETANYVRARIRFTAEPGEEVPGYLLKPKRGGPPWPVMICLQGHSPGMHLSIGVARNVAEREAIAGGRDLALQAVKHGWAALVIEQRAFGVRAGGKTTCNDAALHALHRGRPLTGQRVFDVMRAVDFVGTQPDLDARRIGSMGNSTGGTVTFYAACIDPRITMAVASCSFCTFEDSWLSRPHCACGYLPGIGAVADMPDLAGLIAPRRLLIVAGKEDKLARFDGVQEGFRRAREIFAAAGAPNRVRLVAGDGGHQFYPDLAWPVIDDMMR